LSYVITTQIKALIQQEKEEDEDGRVQKTFNRKINKEKREEATNKGNIFFSQLTL
jgi:hypothetical protein